MANVQTPRSKYRRPLLSAIVVGVVKTVSAAVAALPCAVKNKPLYTRSGSQGEMSSNMQRKRGNTLLSICLKLLGGMEITLCTQEKKDLALTMK